MSRTLRAIPFRKQRQHRESMRALAQYGQRRDKDNVIVPAAIAADVLGVRWDMP